MRADRGPILAVGTACGAPIRKALDQLLDVFERQAERYHAHELAETIRKHWYPEFPGKAEYTQGMDDGYDKAAALIDPEVPGG